MKVEVNADMLEALKLCLEQLSANRPKKFSFSHELAIAAAGSAIAKAEGKIA